jgi:flagellar biosynthesis protein FlhB
MSSSEEPTHDPSPRKIARARLAGHVVRSRDLGAAVVLLGAGVSMLFAVRSFVGGLTVFMRDALGGATGEFSGRGALDAGVRAAIEALALPVAAIVVSALTINLVQTRGLFRRTLVSPDSARLVPRLHRLLDTDRLLIACGGVIKVAVLLLVSAAAVVVVAPSLLGLCGGRPSRMLEGLLATSKTVGATLALAMLALGIGDYVWQLRRHSKSLRMSPDEVKREQRESEGDPVFKHERKRIHVELTQALASFAESDVVVLDPRNAAVALCFAPEVAAAPVVTRKGCGAVASYIESLAAEAGVPIVVNPDLAAALAETEEGGEIPEGLYGPVAALIADAKSTGVAKRGGATADCKRS